MSLSKLSRPCNLTKLKQGITMWGRFRNHLGNTSSSNSLLRRTSASTVGGLGPWAATTKSHLTSPVFKQRFDKPSETPYLNTARDSKYRKSQLNVCTVSAVYKTEILQWMKDKGDEVCDYLMDKTKIPKTMETYGELAETIATAVNELSPRMKKTLTVANEAVKKIEEYGRLITIEVQNASNAVQQTLAILKLLFIVSFFLVVLWIIKLIRQGFMVVAGLFFDTGPDSGSSGFCNVEKNLPGSTLLLYHIGALFVIFNLTLAFFECGAIIRRDNEKNTALKMRKLQA